ATVSDAIAGLPAGATFDAETMELAWTPGYAQAGTYYITVTATDDGDGTGVPAVSTVVIPIVVSNANRAPEIGEIANAFVDRGAVLEIPVTATDSDGNPLELTITGLPRFATVTQGVSSSGYAQALIRFAPGFQDRGDYAITVVARDNGDGNVNQVQAFARSFVVTARSTSEAPVITAPVQVVAVAGQALGAAILVSDLDQDALTITLDGLPQTASLVLDPQYGHARLVWTPTLADVGTYDIDIVATDSGLPPADAGYALPANPLPNTTRRHLRVVVRAANAAPVLLGARLGVQTLATTAASIPVAAQEGAPVSLTLFAADADADLLNWEASGVPEGMNLQVDASGQTATLAWTPGAFAAQGSNIEGGANGRYLVHVSASDGAARFERDIEIAVANTNLAPRILPLPLQLVSEGETLSFTVRPVDGDNDAMALQLLHDGTMPAGVLFDDRTGYFEWTPGADVVNNAALANQPFTFTFSASDGQATTTQTVQVRVFDTNRAPRIIASNHALVAGASFSLPLVLGQGVNASGFSAFDPDGDAQTQALVIRFDGLPEGAVYDAVTKRLNWTPGPGQIGDYVVTAVATDGAPSGAMTARQSFVLRVVVDEAANAPEISVTTTPSAPALPGQLVLATVRADSYSAIASLSVQVRGLDTTLPSQWQTVALDGAGRLRLTPARPGLVDIKVTATDVDGFSRTEVHSIRVRDAADTEGPGLAWIAALLPPDGTPASIVAATPLRAHIVERQLMDWQLQIAAVGSQDGVTLARQAFEASAVDADRDLATLDPAQWANGVYRLRLSATDLAGRTRELETRIVVDSLAKAAPQALVSDGSYALAGHEFALTRVLPADTVGTVGDFGNWQLAGLATKLTQDQVAAADQPEQTAWRNGARVWLQAPVLAGGASQNLRFTLAIAPERLGTDPAAPVVWRPVFASSQSGWSLVAHAGDGDAPEALQRLGSRLYQQAGESAGLPWVPTRYTLTGPDDTSYELDAAGRVTGVRFADGAQWLVSDEGIAAVGSDQRVEFLRDSAGRVVRASLGQQSIAYRYDGAGRVILARSLGTGGSGSAYAYGGDGRLLTDSVVANLGAAVSWTVQGVPGAAGNGQWTGSLGEGVTTLAFAVRDSEIASTVKAPGAPGAVIVAIETSTDNGTPTLEVTGAVLLGTSVSGNVQTTLLRVTEAGLKLIRLHGQGTAQVRVSIAGDLNRDGAVDGADSAQASSGNRQLVYANYGFRANQAPVDSSGGPLKTHLDLQVQARLDSIAGDLEGDMIFWQVLGASHGTAALSGDGRFLAFTPEDGYAGPATITLQADDGFARGAPIELTVNVSAARLLAVHIINLDRLAAMRAGESAKVQAIADFEDQQGVFIGPDAGYLTVQVEDIGALGYAGATAVEVDDARDIVRTLRAGQALVSVLRITEDGRTVRAAVGVNAYAGSDDPMVDMTVSPDVYPGTLTLVPDATRQLKVTVSGDLAGTTADVHLASQTVFAGAAEQTLQYTDPDNGETLEYTLDAAPAVYAGTRYVSSDDSIASVSANGLITAHRAGQVTITVIHLASVVDDFGTLIAQTIGQSGIALLVTAPQVVDDDPASATPQKIAIDALQGGVVQGAQGERVYIGAGALAADADVAIQRIALADVQALTGIAAPAAGVLDAVGAFSLDIGEQESAYPMQLEIPLQGITGAVGEEVLFLRRGEVPVPGGGTRATWWLVDNGFIASDSQGHLVARTASPPYSGVSSSGEYLVAKRISGVVGSTLSLDLGAGSWLDFGGLGLTLGGGLMGMGIASEIIGILASMAGVTGGTYRFGVPQFADIDMQTVQNNRIVVSDLLPQPATPWGNISITQITGASYDSAAGALKLTVTTPPATNPVAQALRTAGTVVLRATFADGRTRDIQTFPAGTLGSEVMVTPPAGLPIAGIQWSLVRQIPTDQIDGSGQLVKGQPIEFEGNGVKVAPAPDIAAVLTRTGIQFVRENKVVGEMALLNLLGDNSLGGNYVYGTKVQSVAFSTDLSRAYVAVGSMVQVIDMVSFKVIDTIRPPSAKNISSLAFTADMLLIGEGSAYGDGAGSNRILLVSANPSASTYHKSFVSLKGTGVEESPFGVGGMVVGPDGATLVVTLPKARTIFGSSAPQPTGDVIILDLKSLDFKSGKIDKPVVAALVNGNRIQMPQTVTATDDWNRFLVSSTNDYNAGLGTLQIQRDADGHPVAAKLASVSMNQADHDVRIDRLNIQRAQSAVLVTYKGVEYAIVGDDNYNFLDPYVKAMYEAPMFEFLIPFGPPVAIGGSASAKKVAVGGKLGIVKDPFGKDGAPQYLGATLPLDGYGIVNLSLSDDGKVLIGQLKGGYSVNIYDGVPKPHQNHAWNVQSLLDAALAMSDADRKSKHIVLPTNAEQLIALPGDPTSRRVSPAGTAFDPAQITITIKDISATDFNSDTRKLTYDKPEYVNRPTIKFEIDVPNYVKGVSDDFAYIYISTSEDRLFPGVNDPFGNANDTSPWYKFSNDGEKFRADANGVYQALPMVSDDPKIRDSFAGRTLSFKVKLKSIDGTKLVFEALIPEEAALTSSQDYFLGIRYGDKFKSTIATKEFVTPSLRTPGEFAGITLLTHGFQPAIEAGSAFTSKSYLIGRQMALQTGGGLFVYQPDTGKWLEYDPASPATNRMVPKSGDGLEAMQMYRTLGRPIFLVSDWYTESGVSTTGFAEAAADAIYDSLARLNVDLKDSITKTNLHLIGHSRGTVVTSEIVQRLGQHGLKPASLQTTFLDVHDFNQPSLSLGGVLRVADFADPDVIAWDNSGFVENYYERVVDEASGITFNPNGRSLWRPDAQPALAQVNGKRAWLSGANIDYSLDAMPGFAYDGNILADIAVLIAGPHGNTQDWYAGTASLALPDLVPGKIPVWRHFSNSAAFRGTNVYLPWYVSRLEDGKVSGHAGTPITTVGELANVLAARTKDSGNMTLSFEGGGEGWFYSALGGGYAYQKNIKFQGAQWSVWTDNSERPVAGESGYQIVNGNFQLSDNNFNGRVLPVYDLPGWSIHNGDALGGDSHDVRATRTQALALRLRADAGKNAFVQTAMSSLGSLASPADQAKMRTGLGDLYDTVFGSYLDLYASSELAHLQEIVADLQRQSLARNFANVPFRAGKGNDSPELWAVRQEVAARVVTSGALQRGLDAIEKVTSSLGLFNRPKVWDLATQLFGVDVRKLFSSQIDLRTDAMKALADMTTDGNRDLAFSLSAASDYHLTHNRLAAPPAGATGLAFDVYFKTAPPNGEPLTVSWIPDDGSDPTTQTFTQTSGQALSSSPYRAVSSALLKNAIYAKPFGRLEFRVDGSNLGNTDVRLDNIRFTTPASPLSLAGAVDGETVTAISAADIQPLLVQAIAAWTAAGANTNLLRNVTLEVADLDGQALAVTEGQTITFDSRAAGAGWFVDSTPGLNEEFVLGTGTALVANVAASSDRIDLYSVVLHELGHVLGYQHDDTDSVMGALLSPGTRRLLETSAQPAYGGTTITVRAATGADSAQAPSAQLLLAVHPTLDASGWTSLGQVTAGTDGSLVLVEGASTQTSLAQAFLIGAQDRFLTFTVTGAMLQFHAGGAQDAFEVALLDAITGANLLGGMGLSHGDAVLNLQDDGAGLAARRAAAVTGRTAADGSTQYTIDLRALAAGTAVNLSFDLIGFGAADSHVGLRDVRLVSDPLVRDDQAAVLEDGVVAVEAMANDTDTALPGYAAELVSGPAHGSVSVNAGGTFTYTPSPDYFGTDTFRYRIASADGIHASNVASVTISVAPVNDAPIASPVTVTLEEDGTASPALAVSDVDSGNLVRRVVVEPRHGSITIGTDGIALYRPDHDFFGTDSFSYVANDGELDSAPALVSITVTPVNDQPVARDVEATLAEDGSVVVDLRDSGFDVEDAVLTPVILTGPAHGSFTLLADGRYQYTPEADFNGTDTVRFALVDSEGAQSNEATLTLTVAAVNDAPTLADQDMAGDEDTLLSGSLLATAGDIDSIGLTARIVAGPVHGRLAVNSDGSFSYQPDADYFGSDSFTYRVSDGELESALATVQVRVIAVNDAPVAADQDLAVDEDTELTGAVVPTASDVDSSSLTAALLVGPAHGSVALHADGSFRYTASANYFGADSFTYTVSDGELTSEVATVRIAVASINDVPVAQDATVTTAEDTPLAIDLRNYGSDVEDAVLAPVIVSGPSHGALVAQGDGTYRYVPAADYNGGDAIRFALRDSAGALSNEATLSITVTAVNDAPTLGAQSLGVDEDGILAGNVLATARDIDSVSLAAVLVNGPAHGTLQLEDDGRLRYTPDADYFGGDSFQVMVTDGALASAVATFSVTVAPINDEPTLSGQVLATAEDTVVAGNLLATAADIDSGALGGALVDGPAHGSLAINTDGTFSYTPDANYFGSDAFTFRVSDGALDSATATVRIDVAAVNDVPTAQDATLQAIEDTVLAVDFRDFGADIEDTALQPVILSGPAHGVLVRNADGSYRYEPAADFNGTDVVRFALRDTEGALSNEATLTFTVTAVNDAPTVGDRAIAGTEDRILRGSLLATAADVDSSSLSARMVTGPAHGHLLVGDDGSFVYTPDLDYFGNDSFSYRVSDGQLDSGLATVLIALAPVNDAPWAGDQALDTGEDSPLTGNLLASASDVDSTVLTATLASGPAHGSVALQADGGFLYTANANFFGADSFTYTVSDGALASNVATVRIAVAPVNDVPLARDASVATDEDTPLAIDLRNYGRDVEDAVLTPVIVSGPSHGALVAQDDGSYRYVPAADYNGGDAIRFALRDGAGALSNEATLAIGVTPVNDAPTLTGQSLSTAEDTSLAGNALADAADIDSAALAALLVTGPTHGTLHLNANGSFSYTPDADYVGSDSFEVQVSDGALVSATATVAITVTPVNDAPRLGGRTLTLDEDTFAGGDLLATATDVDSSGLTALLVAGPRHGTLVVDANGSFGYTPYADYFGADSFSYRVSDGQLESATATVAIQVASVNDVPVARDASLATPEDTPLVFDFRTYGNDVEAGVLQPVVISGPGAGSLVANQDGTYTYLPRADYNGGDAIRFALRDSAGALSNPATVAIAVAPVNDAPTLANQTLPGNEDQVLSGNLLATAGDVDSTVLAASIVAGPAHGALSLHADGSFSYTPTANFFGSDTFTWQVSDGALASRVATFTLQLAPVNDAPVAQDANLTTDEDRPATIDLRDFGFDVEGSLLQPVIVAGPAHGTFTANPDGSYRYTPAADYHGDDSVRFALRDGAGALSNEATLRLIVNSVNDAPVARDIAATLPEDGYVLLDLAAAASDVDGDTLTVTAGSPQHGSLLQQADGRYRFTPAADYFGGDTFTYTVTDGTLSTTGRVTLAVTAVNDKPVAVGESVTVADVGSVVIDVLANDSDVDNTRAQLRPVIVAGPAHGTVSLNVDGTVTYRPASGYSGPDSFQYAASDGQLQSDPVTVTLNVIRTNRDPEFTSTPPAAIRLDTSYASGDSVWQVSGTTGNTTTNFTLTQREAALKDEVGYFVVDDAQGRIGTLRPGDAGYAAAALSSSRSASVFSGSASQGSTQVRPMPAGQYLGFYLIQDSSVGNWRTRNSANQLSKTPLAFFSFAQANPDGFDHLHGGFDAQGALTLRWEDLTGGGDQDFNDVVLTVRGLTAAKNGLVAQLNYDADAVDPDGDALTYSLAQAPQGASIDAATGRVTWTTSAAGTYNFSVVASDNRGGVSAQTFTLTVQPPNHAPVANADAAASQEDATVRLNLLANDTDADADALTAEIVTGPRHGTVTRNTDGTYSYRPDQDWYGTETFSYRVTDGFTWSQPTTVTITVAAVNDAPEAFNASYTVQKGGSIRVELDDLVKDVDSSCLTIAVGRPAHGTVARNQDGSYTYRPQSGFTGVDSFIYTVSDGQRTATGVITLLVVPAVPSNSCSSVTVTSQPGGGTSSAIAAQVQYLLLNLAGAAGGSPNSGVPVDWSQVTDLGSLLGSGAGNPGWLAELLAGCDGTDLQQLAQQVGLCLKL
ncbi:MAG: hypothetical protein JWQ76_1269, partial [Ramlibacter sp.]|nr:hypothetical protein [Ramlibacter sp.]